MGLYRFIRNYFRSQSGVKQPVIYKANYHFYGIEVPEKGIICKMVLDE